MLRKVRPSCHDRWMNWRRDCMTKPLHCATPESMAEWRACLKDWKYAAVNWASRGTPESFQDNATASVIRQAACTLTPRIRSNLQSLYIITLLTAYVRVGRPTSDVQSVSVVRNLGVYLNSDVTLRARVTATARNSTYNTNGQRVVGHYAQFHCSLGSDTRHSREVMGGEGCCVLAPDWWTS